jgi:hypothetical protein
VVSDLLYNLEIPTEPLYPMPRSGRKSPMVNTVCAATLPAVNVESKTPFKYILDVLLIVAVTVMLFQVLSIKLLSVR